MPDSTCNPNSICKANSICLSNFICFSLTPQGLPVISALDIASIKPPYVHFHRHYHEFILYYIVSGELFITEGDENYHLKANDFLLLDPARAHFGQKPSTAQFFYIHFSLPPLLETDLAKEDVKDLLQKTQLAELTQDYLSNIYLPKYHSISSPSSITQIHTLLNKALETFSSHELYHPLQASCLLYELLIVLSKSFSYHLLYDFERTPSASAQTIPLLLSFLNQSYAMNISSTLIESKFNCNFDYLNRQFKKMTGQTIFVYLNSLRIEKAKQLLSTGFYTTSDIASRTGFHDVYYFSKVFKRLTGTTPGKYGKLKI